jgi:WXG100 family type VII secretion target
MTTGVFGDIAALERTAADLEHTHSELEQATHTLDELTGELTTPAAGWQGAASEAFQALATDRRTSLHHLVAAVAATGHAIHRLAGRLEAAEQEAVTARARAEASGVPIDPDFRVQPVLTASPADPALVAAMGHATAELEAAHGLAERAWEDAAAELAAVQLHHAEHGAGHAGVALGVLHKLRGVVGAPGSVAATLGERAEHAWAAFERSRAYRHLSDPPLRGAAKQAARAAVRTAREQAIAATATAERAAALAGRMTGPGGALGSTLKVVGTEVGELGSGAASVPGVRRLPVVGAALAGAATVAESGEAGWGRSLAANGGALVAGEAAAIGLTAAAAVVGAPVAVTVGAAAVVGYGLATTVHSLVLHGDLREFSDDAHIVAGGAGKLWKAVTPW